MGALHQLKVGCGDAAVITGANHTFLIDTNNIGDHAALLPSSKKLRGVFITHQHRDHFSGLQYLRDNGYSIDFLIHSPYQRRYNDASVQLDEWNEFGKLREYFVANGTETRDPFRQDTFDEAWWKDADVGLSFWMLGPHQDLAKSDTRELHDACLVIKATMGSRHCLFTGDASDALLRRVADTTTNICGDVLSASHHGSINGAEEVFIKACSAAYTVISTEEGVHENVPHRDAIARYNKHTSQRVFRTDHDGSVRTDF